MASTLRGFTVSENGYERPDDGGRWLVEKKEYLQADDSAPKRFYWEVAARTPLGSISAQFRSDPLLQESVRLHIENAPPVGAGPLACSSWFGALEALTDGAAFVMDRWLKVALRKSDATPDHLARRSKFIDAARATGWTIDENILANFEGDIAQSPDLIASRDEHEVRYFVLSNLVEARAGGLLVRMLAPSNFEASLRSLDPLVEQSARGAVEWVRGARPLHEACMLREPSGAWVALELPS